MEYQRLEWLCKKYFGDVSTLARAMGKHEKTFYPYKKGNFGRKILNDLESFGISKDFLSGDSEYPFADNESGKALAAKFDTGTSTSKGKNYTLPAWAASIMTTPSERLAKVIELLGGLEQAEAIISTPRDEIQIAIDREDGRFPVVRDCAKLGFSMDWIYLAKGMYYDGTEKGAALRKAVETNTTADWAFALYRKALLENDTTPKAPRTVGSRMALSRLWLCEYHGIPSTPKSFAEFLTKSAYNYAKHVFTASQVQEWEAGITPPNDSMPIAGEEGMNVFWIMTGMENYPFFNDNDAGERLAEWYEKRSV
ncbi:MAG: hypothetical protein IM607_15635, partial [Cytophagales bacterium]|nr:hypothetical protein [Cytophagales bacterium]